VVVINDLTDCHSAVFRLRVLVSDLMLSSLLKELKYTKEMKGADGYEEE
jgi:hypothetical protein